jgi:hypothetical protein
VVVVTEDTGMLAKAKHDNLTAIKVRELPISKRGVAEMLLDRDLLTKLEPPRHQTGQPNASSGQPTSWLMC